MPLRAWPCRPRATGPRRRRWPRGSSCRWREVVASGSPLSPGPAHPPAPTAPRRDSRRNKAGRAGNRCRRRCARPSCCTVRAPTARFCTTGLRAPATAPVNGDGSMHMLRPCRGSTRSATTQRSAGSTSPVDVAVLTSRGTLALASSHIGRSTPSTLPSAVSTANRSRPEKRLPTSGSSPYGCWRFAATAARRSAAGRTAA